MLVSCRVTLFCTYHHTIHYFLERTLRWRHNGRDGVSNHQPHDCLPSRLFKGRSQETSKLRVIGLCGGNSPVTGEFPSQKASNAVNVSIWWRHHEAEGYQVQSISLTPGRSSNFKRITSEHTLRIKFISTSCEIALGSMSQNTFDKSTFVQVMVWCRQATSHYLNQCWPRSMSPYGVTRPH